MSSVSPSVSLGALPARFRRQRWLIVGCGDVGQRVARDALRQGNRGPRILALTSSAAKVPMLRSQGIEALRGNLDQPASLRRLAGLAHRVLHLAPPPGEGAGQAWWRDPRTVALAQALRLRSAPLAAVYASTSGVYGDCQGALVPETRPLAPATPRAQRRVHAERAMRFWGRSSGVRVALLRIPGIYAPDREGGTPQARLLKGTPVLCAQDDVYTNHIHADDLARACTAALWRARPQRAYNVSDSHHLKMGDYFDLAADLYGLPRPPRLSRDAAQQQLPLMLLSFMGESRRLDNQRLRHELGVRLIYPSVEEGLRSLAPDSLRAG